MIRALVIVIVAGFLTSIACLSLAIAIGGPDLVRGDWNWDIDSGPHRFVWRSGQAESGPQAQRAFPWTGASSLEVDAPAEIDYVQAAGPAKLSISGPAAELDRVRVDGSRISLASGDGVWRRLHITLSAPAVTRFELNGANTLHITGYDQDKLAIAVSGHGSVDAAGQAKSVDLNLSGAGDADFSDLKTAGAAINISGAGKATVGPTRWARLQISGVGEVSLLTRPAQLETHISGAGRVRQPGQDSVGAGASSSGGDQDDNDDDAQRGPPRAA
jgi:hypothetical protein